MAATLFAACLDRLGLSQSEAATLLGIAKVTRIKDMASGRSRVPDGIWPELRAYEAKIIDRSETLREALEESSAKADGPPGVIDAVVDDAAGLMGLADFVLTNDVTPGAVQVGIIR